MHRQQQPGASTHLAVFARGKDVLLIDLATGDGALRESASALAMGYVCCGFFTVENGVTEVECQPGLRAAVGMLNAGVALAELQGVAAGPAN
jgi:hypothetical protein